MEQPKVPISSFSTSSRVPERLTGCGSSGESAIHVYAPLAQTILGTTLAEIYLRRSRYNVQHWPLA